jgi:hypothetical protein
MQYGFNSGELVAARAEKATGCPQIYVIVRKSMLEVSGNSRNLPQWYFARILENEIPNNWAIFYSSGKDYLPEE